MAKLTRDFLLQREAKVLEEIEVNKSRRITTETYDWILSGFGFNYVYLAWLSWFLHNDLEKTRDYLYLTVCVISDMFRRDERHEANVNWSFLGLVNINESWHALVANAPELAVDVMAKTCVYNEKEDKNFWKLAGECSIALIKGDEAAAREYCGHILNGPFPSRYAPTLRKNHEPFGRAFQAILDRDLDALEESIPAVARRNQGINIDGMSFYPHIFVLGVLKIAQMYGLEIKKYKPRYPKELLHLPESDFSHIDRWWERIEIHPANSPWNHGNG